MKRRTFIQSSALAGLSPLALSAHAKNLRPAQNKEWYELRTYEIRFGGNQRLLIDYLNGALQPALRQRGAKRFMLFREWGQTEPAKLWLWIAYPDINAYTLAQDLSADAEFREAAAGYDQLPSDQALYNRYSSWLLHAFDGLPQALDPGDAGLFELRIYESFSEDALRRKIRMFNKEELDLFYKVDLNPVFFAEMMAGPYRPCLAYMIHFKDMAQRDAHWKAFGQHPDWAEMRVKEEYADSVSNIQRIFLAPL